jgi:uncharacterized membrane protein YfcA
LDPVLASLIVCLAGVAMGFINNLAGAGGVLALLAFDMAAGLDTLAANASMRPAALGLALGGILGFRSRGERVPAAAFGYALWTLPGAIAGTILAIRLPTWVYDASLFAVIVCLTYRLLARPGKHPQEQHGGSSRLASALWFTAVGVHMGFLQVGVGLLAILALQHVHSRDLVQINIAKTALVAVSAVTSLIAFTIAGEIVWGPALSLTLGAGIGSFAAARFSLERGHGAIRIAVLSVCALLAVRLIAQHWPG